MKIFDTHAHYNDEKFDLDREELLKRIKTLNVDKVVLIGASLEDTISEKNLFNQYNGNEEMPKFYYTVGVHPDDIIKELPDSEEGKNYLSELKKFCFDELGNLKAVAIGEIGLDYFGDYKNEQVFENQKKWFIAQIGLARELNLPIVVHSRDACKDTFDIIKEYASGMKGVIHCFSYEKEIADEYIKLGFYIGIGGTVTFKNARKIKEVAINTPIEYIVTETDCPYMAPTPHRGERNDSSLIKYIIEEIAKIKNMDIEKVSNMLYNNACKLYNLR